MNTCARCEAQRYNLIGVCEDCWELLHKLIETNELLLQLVSAQQDLIDIYETNCDRSQCEDDEMPQDMLDAEQNIAKFKEKLGL